MGPLENIFSNLVQQDYSGVGAVIALGILGIALLIGIAAAAGRLG
jgi:hypothetical protein